MELRFTTSESCTIIKIINKYRKNLGKGVLVMSSLTVSDYRKKLKAYLNPSDELILEAIQFEGTLISQVATSQITPKLARIACENNGMAILCLPERLRTDELYLLGLKSNPLLIKHTPKRLLSETIWRECLNRCAEVVKFLPDELKHSLTEEEVEHIVRENGNLIKYIPYPQRTTSVCLIAAHHFKKGHILNFVPKRSKTEEICFAVLKNENYGGGASEFIPRKYTAVWGLIEKEFLY